MLYEALKCLAKLLPKKPLMPVMRIVFIFYISQCNFLVLSGVEFFCCTVLLGVSTV
jgi:hypothetical protein